MNWNIDYEVIHKELYSGYMGKTDMKFMAKRHIIIFTVQQTLALFSNIL